MLSVIAVIFLALCFAGMAVGLLRKRDLKRGCSLGDDCTCRNDPVKLSQEDCEHKEK